MEGTIRTLQLDKGYGFIRSAGVDHFFHVNDMIGLPWADSLLLQPVTFTAQQSDKGLRAVDVRELRN